MYQVVRDGRRDVARQHIDIRVRSAAAPAAVYALLIDGASWPTWSPIDSYTLERTGPDEPEGVGAIRLFRTGRVKSRERVIERVPDRQFSYELVSGLAIRDYRADVRLAPDGSGTQIHWHSSFDAKLPGTGRLYRRTLDRFIRRSVDGLAARAGSGPVAPADLDPFHRRLHHVPAGTLSGDTAQSTGMRRLSAISGATVGSRNLWMGQTHVAADTRSANHHHGHSETAIYVASGHPVFVFLELDGEHPRETRVETKPGDYIFVPPYVPHREENPDQDQEAVVIISRTTQEAIVVNLDSLSWATQRP
jgi:uncharacterized RmlC-like cupin family protein